MTAPKKDIIHQHKQPLQPSHPAPLPTRPCAGLEREFRQGLRGNGRFSTDERRDKAAALRFFEKAMKASDVPEKVTLDKSGANKAARDELNARGETPIIVRQVKSLNNLVEQDPRAIKRVPTPMFHFKSFRAAKWVLAGIELMHMICKGQLLLEGGIELSFADPFDDWQEKSVPFEELAFVLARNTFISRQRDRANWSPLRLWKRKNWATKKRVTTEHF